MEMNFGLLDEDELSGLCFKQRDHDWKRLRNSEPDIRDVDQVACPALNRTRQPAHPQLNIRVVKLLGFDFPGESQPFELLTQL